MSNNKLIDDIITTCCFFWKKGEGILWHPWRLFSPENRDVLEELLSWIVKKYVKIDRIVGIETLGVPMATLLASKFSIPLRISVLRIGFPRIRPSPASSELIMLMDDLVSAAEFFQIGSIILKPFEPRDIVQFTVAYVPLGISAKVRKELENRKLDIPKQKNLTRLESKIDKIVSFSKIGDIDRGDIDPSITCPEKPEAFSIKVTQKDFEDTLDKVCVERENDYAKYIASWRLLNHTEEFREVCGMMAEEGSKLECNAVLSASLWALPLSTMVSYYLKVPLVYVREDEIDLKIEPPLNYLKNCKRLLVIDSLMRGGEKLQFLYSALPKNIEIYFKTSFETEEDIERKIPRDITKLQPIYKVPLLKKTK
ncbi:MAG: hypothetical protein H3Z52_13750 [archaeon]|nr:hypothetical protein [archaeon]